MIHSESVLLLCIIVFPVVLALFALKKKKTFSLPNYLYIFIELVDSVCVGLALFSLVF